MAVPLKHDDITLERLEKFQSATYWTDCNIRSVGYQLTVPITDAWKIGPVEKNTVPGKWLHAADWEPCKIGDKFGPSWSAFWIKLQIHAPEAWREGEFLLRFDCECEALLFEPLDGEHFRPLSGFNGGNGHDKRHDFTIAVDKEDWGSNATKTLFIELTCNGMFGVGDNGFIKPPDPAKYFTLKTLELKVVDGVAHGLFHDFAVIYDCARLLDKTDPRQKEALFIGNSIVNTFRHDDPKTWVLCRGMAAKFLRASQDDIDFKVHCLGHCHIDTAWLWSFDQTKKKVARSWSSAVHFMRDGRWPWYRFCASQAVQYDWMKQLYPALWRDMLECVKQGSFIPVGGSWVEMDANMPSGESFVRQLLLGQTFFEREFGKPCEVFWLPDTFGYSPQLPQLLRSAGMKYFLSQKLSWNLVNKFPHSTFWWEGLDGSKVLAHFPPANTYSSSAGVEDILKSQKQSRDLGRCSDSLLLYGHGDGGGGPTREMLFTRERLLNLKGLPVAPEVKDINETFAAMEGQSNRGPGLATWRGELYFELHQGTLTSQAGIKQGNRVAEAILHQAECISALLFGLAGRSTENEVGVSNKRRRVELDAAEEVKEEAKKTFDDDDLVPHLLLGTDYTMANGVPPTFSLCLFTPISQGTMQYPEELLRNAWQDVLLCQFHDVLPGSCIPEVRKDAEDYLSRVRSGVGVLVGEGCKSLGECIMRGWQASAPTSATASSGLDATITPYFVWNGTDADRTEVVLLRDEPEPADVDSIQPLPPQGWLCQVSVPSYGYRIIRRKAQPATEEELIELGDSIMSPPPEAAAVSSPEPIVGVPPESLPPIESSAATAGGEESKEEAAEPEPRPRSDSTSTLTEVEPGTVVTWSERNTQFHGYMDFHLCNGLVHVAICGKTGYVKSYQDLREGFVRDILQGGVFGGQLRLHEDVPFYWDAWDTMPYAKEGFTDAATGIVFSEQRYHLPANDSELTGATAGALHPEALGREPEQGSVGNEWQGGSTASEAKHRASKDLAAEYKACERPLPVVCWDLRGPLRASVTATYCIGRYSVVKQRITLDGHSPMLKFQSNVHWREKYRMLRVSFPLNVKADTVAYEMQFGMVKRPTHQNTSWDLAKHEVCGHRWADMSEHGYGVALINDCKYGYSASGSELSLSLLHSPRAPDDACDITGVAAGVHRIRYALLPHFGTTNREVIDSAAAFNLPLHAVALNTPAGGDVPPPASMFRLEPLSSGAEGIVLDTIKKAESGADLVLRLYEGLGGRGRVKLMSALPIESVELVNILEKPLSEGADSKVKVMKVEDRVLHVAMHPYQVATLRITIGK